MYFSPALFLTKLTQQIKPTKENREKKKDTTRCANFPKRQFIKSFTFTSHFWQSWSLCLLLSNPLRLRRRTTPTTMLMMMPMRMTVSMPMPMIVMMMNLLPLQLLPHIIGVLPISIVLCLNIMNLVPQRFRVEIEGSPIALPHVKRHVLSPKHLLHCVLRRVHELRGQPELAVCPEHR